jgi:hypothetical protein
MEGLRDVEPSKCWVSDSCQAEFIELSLKKITIFVVPIFVESTLHCSVDDLVVHQASCGPSGATVFVHLLDTVHLEHAFDAAEPLLKLGGPYLGRQLWRILSQQFSKDIWLASHRYRMRVDWIRLGTLPFAKDAQGVRQGLVLSVPSCEPSIVMVVRHLFVVFNDGVFELADALVISLALRPVRCLL